MDRFGCGVCFVVEDFDLDMGNMAIIGISISFMGCVYCIVWMFFTHDEEAIKWGLWAGFFSLLFAIGSV